MPDLRVPRRFRSAAPILVTVAAAAVGACSSSSSKDLSAWKSQKSYGSEMARKGFWREALFRYEKAAALSPDNAEVQNNLGVAYESVGETSHALAAYKRALELAPQDPKIKRNYARFAEYYTSVQRASSLPAPSSSAPQPSPSPVPGAAEKPGSTGPPIMPPSVGTVPSGESSGGTPPSAQNPPSPPPAPTPGPGGPPPGSR